MMTVPLPVWMATTMLTCCLILSPIFDYALNLLSCLIDSNPLKNSHLGKSKISMGFVGFTYKYIYTYVTTTTPHVMTTFCKTTDRCETQVQIPVHHSVAFLAQHLASAAVGARSTRRRRASTSRSTLVDLPVDARRLPVDARRLPGRRASTSRSTRACAGSI